MAISVSVKVRLQLGHYNRFSRTCSVLEVIKQAWDIKYGSRFTVAFFKSLNSHCFLTFWSPYLTIRFHFAVVCSVIDARVTSQRGKNKKVAHETKSRGSQMFLPCCDVLYSCASITEQTRQNGINLFYTINTWKNIFQKIYRGIKKDESRQLTWSMVYTNQATSLARDIAVRSVIGLHKSDQR